MRLPNAERAFVDSQRYSVDFSLAKEDKTARLRSVWNVKPGQNEPRLVTCHVL